MGDILKKLDNHEEQIKKEDESKKSDFLDNLVNEYIDDDDALSSEEEDEKKRLRVVEDEDHKPKEEERSIKETREAKNPTSDIIESDEEIEVFSEIEIVTLRLIFALFDDNGDDFIDMEELVRYAEETGDYALKEEAIDCIKILDIDGDGRIGLWDYINFAARLKELHLSNQHALLML